MSLHKALKNTRLDFFVMTSSISAVLGNPGQANYSAGNSFLDALAWYRRQHGMAASSIALPMVLDVGVVAENQGIEMSLNHKGMYGIDEQEMLAAFEAAMRQGPPLPGHQAAISEAQIILGLDPEQLREAVSSKDATDAYWYNDARLSSIRASMEALDISDTGMGQAAGGDFKASLVGTPHAAAIEEVA